MKKGIAMKPGEVFIRLLCWISIYLIRWREKREVDDSI